MLTELPGQFLWGVPGLVVFLLGQVLVLHAFFGHHKRSLRGARLTVAGFGLLTLGLLVGFVLGAAMRGEWLVAVAVIVVGGWAPLFCFRLAARGIAADD